MGKTYRSFQGKEVDMDKIMARNELMPAVGNAKVNARGDELGPGGKIIRKREQVMAEYYEKRPAAPLEQVKPGKAKKEVRPDQNITDSFIKRGQNEGKRQNNPIEE